jgi:hypothetical protein
MTALPFHSAPRLVACLDTAAITAMVACAAGVLTIGPLAAIGAR